MRLTLSQSRKTELIKLLLVGKALFHMKKLIQSMLCKKDPKKEFFFQKKNSLAHLKYSLLIKKTMIIPKKKELFYLK